MVQALSKTTLCCETVRWELGWELMGYALKIGSSKPRHTWLHVPCNVCAPVYVMQAQLELGAVCVPYLLLCVCVHGRLTFLPRSDDLSGIISGIFPCSNTRAS
jgi:hypothetical protein